MRDVTCHRGRDPRGCAARGADPASRELSGLALRGAESSRRLGAAFCDCRGVLGGSRFQRSACQRGVFRRWVAPPFVAAMSLALSSVLLIAFDGAANAEQPVTSARLGADRFEVGSQVEVRDDSPGDLVAAGSSVDLSGAIGGDALAFGGEVVVSGPVAGDLYSAGSSVGIDSAIAGNARVAGARVVLRPGARVSGGLSAAGAEVVVEGDVGSYLQVAGADVTLLGRVGGDVEAAAERLSLGPGAVVDGSLTVRGPNPPELAAGAQVRGGVRHLAGEEPSGTGWIASVVALALTGLWLLGGGILAGVVWQTFPRPVGRVTTAVLRRPLACLGFGLGLIVGVPVAAIVSLLTIVGAPLAFALLYLYVLLFPLGYAIAALSLARWGLARWGPTSRGSQSVTEARVTQAFWGGQGVRTFASRLVAVVAVLWAFALLGLAPGLGIAVSAVATVLGVGSLGVALSEARRAASRRRRSDPAPPPSAEPLPSA